MDSRIATKSEIVAKLDLKPNPEGGLYSETFRDTSVMLSKSQLPPHLMAKEGTLKVFDKMPQWSELEVDRPVSTCIHYLLPAGSFSHLHRIPCAESWHFYFGEPLTVVELNDNDGSVKLTCLGPDLLADDQVMQYVVPPNVWFGAFPTKDFDISSEFTPVKRASRDPEEHFSLVGCICAPAFQFDDFEMAKRSELISRLPGYAPLISMLTFPD